MGCPTIRECKCQCTRSCIYIDCSTIQRIIERICYASSALSSEAACLVVQVFRTGRDCCRGRSQCYHHFLGSSVCAERPTRHLSGKSCVLQRAGFILLPFFAFLTGAVYSRAALHLRPGMCVQLHCVLVCWSGAQRWYALFPFSSVSWKMSTQAVCTTLLSVACGIVPLLSLLCVSSNVNCGYSYHFAVCCLLL